MRGYHRSLSRLPPYARARLGIAYVPQGHGIFPHLSVEENLVVGLAATPGTARSLGAIPGFVFDIFPALREMFADRYCVMQKGRIVRTGSTQVPDASAAAALLTV